jgi:uncharacterized protein (TIGR02453 family)
MEAARITPQALDFLRDLKSNNNRDWFEEHRNAYKRARMNILSFADGLKERLGTHDHIDKVKLFRIHRDLRFSKDKTPYKPHFAVSFSREGAHRRGGYYLRIRPGESFIACGFWAPEKEDLLRVRKELELDARPFRKATDTPEFRSFWGELQGESVKTAPKGFDKEHPDIDLIRRKQFIFTHHFEDQEVLSPEFIQTLDDHFRGIRPFFDLMSDILTTNLDGESLLDH